MHIIILLIIIIAIIYGPSLWASSVTKLNIESVTVEETKKDDDHYSSTDKAVRLDPNNYHDNSLTAITIAAHEVGHAIQDHQNDPMLRRRHKLIDLTHKMQRLGMFLLSATFVLGLFSRNPLIGVITVIAGIMVMGVSVIVNLVTLPVEYDASFNKALPILLKGNYIEKKDHAAARRILKAAALTYVAASLTDLLNFARWISILRR